jgi:hypothetical protein
MFGLIEFLTGSKGRAETAGKKKAVARLSFDDAIAAHEAWKARLLDVAQKDCAELAQLNVDDVRRDDKCALGKWIHKVAKARFGQDRHFASLCDEHAQFHICAADVIEHARKKRLAYARIVIEGEFTRKSLKVVRLLKALRDKYAGNER